MKRLWVLAGMILLVAGVIFEEKHRAATAKTHLAVPDLVQTGQAAPEVPPYCNFSEGVSLWGGPNINYDLAGLGYPSLAVPSVLSPAGYELLRVKPGQNADTIFTVLDREIAYSLFTSGGFSFSLNFKPEYPNQEAWIPNRIDPGVGFKLSF